MVKKLITVAAGVGLMLVTAAPAFAGNISVGNTGAFSNVTTRIDRLRQHVLTLNNLNTLTQNVTNNITTGSNTASNNTHDGLAAAGNVTKNETSQIEMNTVNVDVDESDNTTCNCTNNIVVDWTGNNSNVTANVYDSKTSTVTITNQGKVKNTFVSNVNTGGNSASYNTGNGTAIGGDVSVSAIITTKLNTLLMKLKL